MVKEKTLCLNIKEVLILRSWFTAIVDMDLYMDKDITLDEKLAAFEKENKGE